MNKFLILSDDDSDLKEVVSVFDALLKEKGLRRNGDVSVAYKSDQPVIRGPIVIYKTDAVEEAS